ncbi:MAG TPA: CAP domain-containing protein [Flavobacteriales bacterium]|nr:CAP domain-containing protein [Flavobacteriales bacterium]
MISGLHYKLVLLAILWTGISSAQKKFIARIDTTWSENKLMAAGALCDGNAELNPYDIDYDLLNCLLMKEMNVYRKKKGLKLLTYEPRLDMIAQNYLNYFNRSAFINSSGNKQRVNRPMKKAAKKLNYNNGLISAIIYQVPVVNMHPKEDYFYYAEGDAPPVNLYYGLKPTQKQIEEGYVFTPVKTYTYNEFVKVFFKQYVLRNYYQALGDKAMRQIGCRCYVIEQSLNKHALPSVNFMLITGAPRLELLPKPKK